MKGSTLYPHDGGSEKGRIILGGKKTFNFTFPKAVSYQLLLELLEVICLDEHLSCQEGKDF